MKKIKIALISLFVCALGYSGYSAYDYMTMTEAERFLLTNVEALTLYEPGGGESLWFRADSDCKYSFTGKANSSASVTVPGVGTVTANFDRNGEWTYTVSGGRTNCTSGGHEQCTARYCN